MDLSAYSLPRLLKEKRERQPNWTEHEKQLLLSLTRHHQAILENKGSDTMTLKRKSEAWNEIALHMNAAGYNRSKERLKQQLGRIRAADAKRVKEALEKSLTMEGNSSNTCGDQAVMLDVWQPQVYNKGNDNFTVPPSPVEDELQIKVERVVSTDEEGNIEDFSFQPSQSECFRTVNIDPDTSSEIVQQSVMHLMLQNIKPFSHISKASINYENDNVQVSPAKTDFTPAPKHAESTDSLNIMDLAVEREDHNVHSAEGEVENERTTSPKVLQKKRSIGRFRLSRFRTPPSKEQRLRQIHLYRLAVERERLRALKIQQKRDRILHRKDLQIQNLKLQILRNITNQTRDGNRINL